MDNTPVHQATNLARLYRLPASATHDTTGWTLRHFEAVLMPLNPFERAFVNMLNGWLRYADAHHQAYTASIGEDGVLGNEWAAIGAGLLELLNGHLGRLDGGTLDSILRDTLHAHGSEEEHNDNIRSNGRP